MYEVEIKEMKKTCPRKKKKNDTLEWMGRIRPKVIRRKGSRKKIDAIPSDPLARVPFRSLHNQDKFVDAYLSVYGRRTSSSCSLSRLCLLIGSRE